MDPAIPDLDRDLQNEVAVGKMTEDLAEKMSEKSMASRLQVGRDRLRGRQVRSHIDRIGKKEDGRTMILMNQEIEARGILQDALLETATRLQEETGHQLLMMILLMSQRSQNLEDSTLLRQCKWAFY